MKPGDYVCVSIPWLHKNVLSIPLVLPNVIGYGIRLFTWSRYDHSFIYIGRGLIVEAQPEGAVVSHIKKYASNRQVVGSAEGCNRMDITDKAVKLVGTPYGFLDIAYLALTTLGIKNKYMLKQVERQDRLICSQLVALAGEEGRADWLCGKANCCLVTPADLARRIIKND